MPTRIINKLYFANRNRINATVSKHLLEVCWDLKRNSSAGPLLTDITLIMAESHSPRTKYLWLMIGPEGKNAGEQKRLENNENKGQNKGPADSILEDRSATSAVLTFRSIH
jgi:hypothetical protein